MRGSVRASRSKSNRAEKAAEAVKSKKAMPRDDVDASDASDDFSTDSGSDSDYNPSTRSTPKGAKPKPKAKLSAKRTPSSTSNATPASVCGRTRGSMDAPKAKKPRVAQPARARSRQKPTAATDVAGASKKRHASGLTKDELRRIAEETARHVLQRRKQAEQEEREMYEDSDDYEMAVEWREAKKYIPYF